MFSVSSVASSCSSSLLNAFKLSTGALSATFVNPVRYRYFKDKPQIIERRWGYKDKLDFRGTLPRVPTSKKLPIPEYTPGNAWSEKNALFGQNDYIDILGDDDSISPIKFAYGVPSWLRGFKGHEYHMLLRKRAFLGKELQHNRPRENHFMRKRLHHLYKRLNRKTKHFMNPAVMKR